jgi:hypothetical protein
MKRHIFSQVSILLLLAGAAVSVDAQLRLPRPSQKASVMQTIGTTDITITYHRPGVKGRTIFADAPKSMVDRAKGQMTLDNSFERLPGEPIVPYGYMWRAGANEATQFVVTDDVMINGQKLAAGSYSLHAIPGKSEWTIVFNGNANQWGSFNYDPAKDTLRVKAVPEKTKDVQEWLMYSIDPVTDNSATVNIRWERVRVPFTVTVDVVNTSLAKARAAVAAAPADNWQIPLNAGTYAMQNNSKEEGAVWLEMALPRLDAAIAKGETWGNLAARANLLLTLGRKEEGLAAADKAIARGKADKANTTVLENRVKEIRAAKH